MTKSLDAVLHKAHIGSRFVLVGHSIGGADALVYGAEHPRQVAGAVLVDPSQAKFFQALHAEPALAGVGYQPQKTIGQIAAVRKWPRVPLIVLARDPAKAVADRQYTAEQEQVWATGARKYSHLSPKGSLITVPGSTHYIYLDAPAVTADAIRTVLAKAR